MECLQYYWMVQFYKIEYWVLNLVINGMPSIPKELKTKMVETHNSFKPCYKWNAFNTKIVMMNGTTYTVVLNLVINGMPSILRRIWCR